jgi:hypothetical protein
MLWASRRSLKNPGKLLPWVAQQVLALDQVADTDGKVAARIFLMRRWAEALWAALRAPPYASARSKNLRPE